MTKTKNRTSLNSCLDQQPWLFPELRNWRPPCPLSLSSENSPSSEQSRRSEQSTPSFSDTMQDVLVSIGDSGRPVGESAANAKYTDAEIDMVFELRNQGYFYREISEMMDMPIRTIRTFLDGSRRNKHVVGWKKLKRKAKK